MKDVIRILTEKDEHGDSYLSALAGVLLIIVIICVVDIAHVAGVI